jgi:hypothetical protein
MSTQSYARAVVCNTSQMHTAEPLTELPGKSFRAVQRPTLTIRTPFLS